MDLEALVGGYHIEFSVKLMGGTRQKRASEEFLIVLKKKALQ